ncbi:MAG: hypothetical protein VW551_00485 [Euryarchaeota archaeon]|jgi:hypothetical protein
MADLKHVGRSVKGQRKCAIAYRVVPNDPDHCLVVYTDTLDSPDHQALMQLIESNTGQNAKELADAMFRTRLPDGRNMLVQFDKMGKLNKVPTTDIEVTPNMQSSIVLAELNKLVAEQQGVTVADLAMSSGSTETVSTEEAGVQTVSTGETDAPTGVLSDEDLAAQFRSQADAMFKEAKRLREQAEELVPTKKAKAKTASGG